MLAIIIPYYKLRFFSETLKSLEKQTDQRFKVYIGDDASPENPSEILKMYKNKFTFTYHRFENNLGGQHLTYQWERCIELSGTEEWKMILGDDDVLGSTVVEDFYNNINNIEERDISVVRFASVKIDEDNIEKSLVYEHPIVESSVDFIFRSTRSSLSEYIFSSEVFRIVRFKPFALGWFSDLLAVLEFSNFSNIYTINSAIIKIRISKESISGSSDNLRLKSAAYFDYYYYLLSVKSKYFSQNQLEILFQSLGKSYIDDKRNIKKFILISVICFKNLRFKDFTLFIKKIYLSL